MNAAKLEEERRWELHLCLLFALNVQIFTDGKLSISVKKNLLPHRQEMLAQGLDPNPPARQDHEKVPFPKYEEYQVGLGVDNCFWTQKFKPY